MESMQTFQPFPTIHSHMLIEIFCIKNMLVVVERIQNLKSDIPKELGFKTLFSLSG